MQTAKRKSLVELRVELYAECRQLAESAFKQYTRYIYTGLYLCGREGVVNGATCWTELFVSGNSVDGGKVVVVELVPRNYTTDQLVEWFHERLKREPLWMYAECA